MERRSSDILLELGDVVLKKTPSLDLSVVQQLLFYRYVYSRYLTLKGREYPYKTSLPDICNELGKELRKIWIFMNVTPITLWGVTSKLKTLLSEFNAHGRTRISKRGETWTKNQSKLSLKLENGFDIRGSDTNVIKNVQKETGVKETSAEDLLYKDNCVPDAKGLCPRRRWNGEPDKEWLRESKKKSERDEYERNLKI